MGNHLILTGSHRIILDLHCGEDNHQLSQLFLFNLLFSIGFLAFVLFSVRKTTVESMPDRTPWPKSRGVCSSNLSRQRHYLTICILLSDLTVSYNCETSRLTGIGRFCSENSDWHWLPLIKTTLREMWECLCLCNHFSNERMGSLCFLKIVSSGKRVCTKESGHLSAVILADFTALFYHISHCYLSWNTWQIQITRVSWIGHLSPRIIGAKRVYNKRNR